MSELTLDNKQIGNWQTQVLRLNEATQELDVPVASLIGNSVPTSNGGKQRTAKWKVEVATAVMAKRGAQKWSESMRYAITVGFSFHLPSHGNQLCDIENFLKPTLDALAAGLFADSGQDWSTLARWNFDDSRFCHLLSHRLDDARSAETEGALLFISAVESI